MDPTKIVEQLLQQAGVVRSAPIPFVSSLVLGVLIGRWFYAERLKKVEHLLELSEKTKRPDTASTRNSPEVLATTRTKRANRGQKSFTSSADVIDQLEDWSHGFVDFTRIGLAVQGVTAEMVFKNADGFEIERIPRGFWEGARNTHVGFVDGEKRRLIVAMKKQQEPTAEIEGADNQDHKINITIPCVSVRVEITLKYFADGLLNTSKHYFMMASDREGRLRFTKQPG
jgi:hypothetical protein